MTIGVPGMWTSNTEDLTADKTLTWGDAKVQLLSAAAARNITLPSRKPSPYSTAAIDAGYTRPNDQDFGEILIINNGAQALNIAGSQMADSQNVSLTTREEAHLQWIPEIACGGQRPAPSTSAWF